MNKKRLIIIVTILLVAIIIGVVVYFVTKGNDTNINNPSNEEKPQLQVTGKLLNYLGSLTDNYYIKYSGKFVDDLGGYKEATVEFTKSKEKFAVKSAELNMNIVYDGEKINGISSRYNRVVQMSKSSFNLNKYHLAADIGQTYIKSYEEKLDGMNYDVEEYSYYQDSLKYYFKDDVLKIIKYNDMTIKVIRMEKITEQSMLKIPDNYEIVIM